MAGRAMTASGKIPTDEEFARASRVMEERARNLDRVREAVLAHFGKRYPLHDFFILDQRDVDFRAYAFLERDEDVEAMRKRGLDRELLDFVYEELERQGRGTDIDVALELDSHENVVARFEGDYSLRLRA